MTSIVSNSASSVLNIGKIQTNFAQYILTPINSFGLGGLVFDVEGSTTIDLQADITDHYLEDNTSVQDNISIRPQRIKFTAYAGDLVYTREAHDNQPIQKVVQKLTVLNQYLPQLAQQSQQAFNTLKNTSQNISFSNLLSIGKSALPVFNNIANIWAAIQNLNPSNGRQQQVYIYLKALMEQKILISLQTPFEFVTNLGIEAINAIQDDTTRSMSTFQISLKKIRVASTQTAVFNPLQWQNTSLPQNQPTQQLGNNQGTDVNLAYLNQFQVITRAQ